MLYIDTKTWLPDDLLIKADKMTMANSVELRVPLLDHQVLEFAASLPPSFKLNGFSLKYILKKALVAENSERDSQPEEDRFPGTLRVLASERSQGSRLGRVDGPQDSRTGLFP